MHKLTELIFPNNAKSMLETYDKIITSYLKQRILDYLNNNKWGADNIMECFELTQEESKYCECKDPQPATSSDYRYNTICYKCRLPLNSQPLSIPEKLKSLIGEPIRLKDMSKEELNLADVVVQNRRKINEILDYLKARDL